MPKQTIRQLMLAKRKALSPLQVERRSLFVQRIFISTAEFARAKVLALYAPIHNEVATAEVMIQALALDKTVLYPIASSGTLTFRRIYSLADLHKGAYGILEPEVSSVKYAPHDIDIIVIPGVAFDLKGGRIGYGKGYYDKALHALEGSGRIVGFSYDFQLLDEIVGEPHDVSMDLIISETRAIRP